MGEVTTYKGFKIVLLLGSILVAYRSEGYMEKGTASYSVTAGVEEYTESLRRLVEMIDKAEDYGEFAEEQHETPTGEVFAQQTIRPECANIAFMVNLVYDRGVALEYDLTCDRLEDAGRRLADLDDMIPQIYGLTELTTREEREQLMKALGNVRHYMGEGDALMAQGAADEFNASFRNIMWNIIVRCEEL